MTTTETVGRLCRCRRGPVRRGQFNCSQCNSEAGKRFRAKMAKAKREIEEKLARAKEGQNA